MPTQPETEFRSTLISEAAVLSTGRNLAVSWCLGSIQPNPQGPGGVIDEESDAVNLERYELLRTEVEQAARIWERHSRMNFVHLSPFDDRRKPSGGTCDTSLDHIWFRAQTNGCSAQSGLFGETNAGGENEFDPQAGSSENPEGYERLVCIARQLLDAAKTRLPYYVGHEIGHIVGLGHEHARWEQLENPPSNCRENHPFVPLPANLQLTPSDPWSVMGYEECEGAALSYGTSPSDMLGAYYTFNWTERRVRDMSPSTGGRDQRYWAGDERPGILWYVPFPDRLLEWRFAAQQAGPLSYEVVERCMNGQTPCAPANSNGHLHPIMGQFTGGSDALDVFMYGPAEAEDALLRNRSHEGFEGFDRLEAPAPDRAVPVVGNFGPGNRDQILWYRPGPASDQLWDFQEDGSHETLPINQDGWRIPLTGHFRARTLSSDIIWFDPRDATIDTWQFNFNFSIAETGATSVELLGVVEGTEYLPIVGNFDGDNRTDLFWYTPGSAPDWLWLSTGNQQVSNFDSYEFAVDGEYHPVVGDFDGDGDDDILWYRPSSEIAGGQSWLWYFDGPNIEVGAFEIAGDYVPYVEDFDNDGCTDILWYDSVAPENDSPVWRCVPNQRTFSCAERLNAPKVAYPIGFATGGY